MHIKKEETVTLKLIVVIRVSFSLLSQVFQPKSRNLHSPATVYQTTAAGQSAMTIEGCVVQVVHTLNCNKLSAFCVHKSHIEIKVDILSYITVK